ncbi:MAG TPA: crotonase/enoyl-CoA hydratase family protein [Aquabacterium sp.]|uniref:crotonase/enoyl-CoA hydratase family protein n=1 Tax=Aquabacterium sp. TaxID=1872578 RepID=UPI002E376718|nr:crotonase/enoyl-CoA hydratase family protein [Aquabacterium sp.]HEX5357431.1 crotonase/enoyl-CoA hydratase family protein [Aquabacterium sp.]
MNDRVLIRVEGAVAHVVLNRADKHNGMDFPMLDAMLAAQKKMRRNRQVRAIILSGDGPSFCSGLDFKTAMSQPVRTLLRATQLLWPFANQFQRWSVGWRKVGVPVIAVVQGNCFGAGLQLALGADIRICRPDAKLSLLEAKWGLVPDMGGITLLRELVPIDVAKELTFTGRVISGLEAHALGLVTHLSEEPMAHAQQLANEIATRSPDSVAAGKYLLQQAWRAGDYLALRAERLWQRRVMGRANQRIALAREQARSKAGVDGEPQLKAFKARQL